MNVATDILAQTNDKMDSLTAFNANFWVHCHSFTVNDDPDEHRLTGLDGRGNVLQLSFETKGTGNVIPLVYLKHKSVLRIGANKMVELVL
jgi:hypothetical protein